MHHLQHGILTLLTDFTVIFCLIQASGIEAVFSPHPHPTLALDWESLPAAVNPGEGRYLLSFVFLSKSYFELLHLPRDALILPHINCSKRLGVTTALDVIFRVPKKKDNLKMSICPTYNFPWSKLLDTVEYRKIEHLKDMLICFELAKAHDAATMTKVFL